MAAGGSGYPDEDRACQDGVWWFARIQAFGRGLGRRRCARAASPGAGEFRWRARTSTSSRPACSDTASTNSRSSWAADWWACLPARHPCHLPPPGRGHRVRRFRLVDNSMWIPEGHAGFRCATAWSRSTFGR